MRDTSPLLTNPELADLSNLFGWNLSAAELTSGLPYALVDSWIDENRQEPLAPLGIAFQPMDSSTTTFVDRMQEVVCAGLFADLFPDHPFETIMQLDFDAMERCLPSYRAPTWKRARFWDVHCLDLISAMLNNDFLFRRFRLEDPPRTAEEARQRYEDLLAAERLSRNAGRPRSAPANDNVMPR